MPRPDKITKMANSVILVLASRLLVILATGLCGWILLNVVNMSSDIAVIKYAVLGHDKRIESLETWRNENRQASRTNYEVAQ